MAKRQWAINPKEVEPEYQKLAAGMGFGGSLYLPRIIKKAFTLEQAKVACEFEMPTAEIAKLTGVSKEELEKDATKYQVEAIAKKLNLDKKTVETYVQYMFEVGFGFPTKRGWRWARTFGQLRDSMTNPKFDEQLGDEFFDLWKAFERLEDYPAVMNASLVEPEQQRLRIMPARKSLKGIKDIVPEDNIEEILKKVNMLGVALCACKRLVRDRDPEIPVEVCIISDRITEHNLKRGSARVISLEEALEIHDKANEAGLVTLPQSNVAQPKMVCHCHWTCCGVLTPSFMVGRPIKKYIAPSCYRPVVNPEKCIGCQTCVTVCQFGAIEMKRYPSTRAQEKFKAWVNPEKCMGCGLCVIKCKAEARAMTQVRTGDTVPREMPALISYTTAEMPLNRGKHLETNSLLTRPLY
ncbi:MAG: 4Fe-4S binding protein [Dehalococcoidales bacterium]|nr:4Fe-4S binding protein [Dehalococcoidales bacterium]